MGAAVAAFRNAIEADAVHAGEGAKVDRVDHGDTGAALFPLACGRDGGAARSDPRHQSGRVYRSHRRVAAAPGYHSIGENTALLVQELGRELHRLPYRNSGRVWRYRDGFHRGADDTLAEVRNGPGDGVVRSVHAAVGHQYPGPAGLGGVELEIPLRDQAGKKRRVIAQGQNDARAAEGGAVGPQVVDRTHQARVGRSTRGRRDRDIGVLAQRSGGEHQRQPAIRGRDAAAVRTDGHRTSGGRQQLGGSILDPELDQERAPLDQPDEAASHRFEVLARGDDLDVGNAELQRPDLNPDTVDRTGGEVVRLGRPGNLVVLGPGLDGDGRRGAGGEQRDLAAAGRAHQGAYLDRCRKAGIEGPAEGRIRDQWRQEIEVTITPAGAVADRGQGSLGLLRCQRGSDVTRTSGEEDAEPGEGKPAGVPGENRGA